jgi:hypothetical protein
MKAKYVVKCCRAYARIRGIVLCGDPFSKFFTSKASLNRFIVSNRKTKKYSIISVNAIKEDYVNRKRRQLARLSGDDSSSDVLGTGTGMDEATLYAGAKATGLI